MTNYDLAEKSAREILESDLRLDEKLAYIQHQYNFNNSETLRLVEILYKHLALTCRGEKL